MTATTGPAGREPARQPGGDRRAAERLAGELRSSSGQLRTWRKVTTLLDMFGYYALTPAVRERIATALAEAGITAEPPLASAQRHETVRLSMAEEAGLAGAGPELAGRDYSVWEPIRAIRALVWRAGEAPEELPLFQAEAIDGITWFEVNVLHADAVSVFDALAPLCSGLRSEAVADLLDGVARPDRLEGMRALSLPGVTAAEFAGSADEPAASKAGTLAFQPVGIVVGDGWLVSCWHRPVSYHGGKEVDLGEPDGFDEVVRAVASRWADGELETSADLALAAGREVLASFPTAQRELEAWLESWELDFYRRLEQTERETLIDLRGLVAEFRARLVEIESQQLSHRRGWPAPVSDPALLEDLDRAVAVEARALRELGDALRNSLDLLAANSAAQQLRLTREQARRTSNLEELVGLIASILLVPTLIAELYGGITNLPGGGEWSGFGILLALMVVSGALAYLAFRRVRDRGRVDPDGDEPGDAGP